MPLDMGSNFSIDQDEQGWFRDDSNTSCTYHALYFQSNVAADPTGGTGPRPGGPQSSCMLLASAGRQGNAVSPLGALCSVTD